MKTLILLLITFTIFSCGKKNSSDDDKKDTGVTFTQFISTNYENKILTDQTGKFALMIFEDGYYELERINRGRVLIEERWSRNGNTITFDYFGQGTLSNCIQMNMNTINQDLIGTRSGGNYYNTQLNFCPRN